MQNVVAQYTVLIAELKACYEGLVDVKVDPRACAVRTFK